MSGGHTPRFHMEAKQRDPYGIMPIGHRQRRLPTVPEHVHFMTCHAAGPYSAVNCQVPAGVPVWQYIDPSERVAAARKCTQFAATGVTL